MEYLTQPAQVAIQQPRQANDADAASRNLILGRALVEARRGVVTDGEPLHEVDVAWLRARGRVWRSRRQPAASHRASRRRWTRQVVQHRRDIEPAPADHLGGGEVGSRTPSFRGHRQRPPRDPLTIVLSSGNQAPSPSTPTSPSTRRSPRGSPGGPRRRGDYAVTPFQLTTQDDIGWRVATITGRPDLQRLQTGSAEPRDSPRGRAACRR
jgi:hypothetical protein